MKIKSLGWAIAITMLTIAPSLAQQEPNAVTYYKRQVGDAIGAFAATMDQRQSVLQTALDEWFLARRHLSRVMEAKHHLEEEKERLEKEKRELEKKLSEPPKDRDKRIGTAIRPLDPNANQIREDIRKKAAEIELKISEIRKAEERKKEIEHGLPAKRQTVTDAGTQVALLKSVIESISSISSPTSDPQTLEKDTAGRSRVEWGPVLQQWIQAQIDTRAQKWTAAPVVVTVDWSQVRFEGRFPLAVAATIKMPSLEPKPIAIEIDLTRTRR